MGIDPQWFPNNILIGGPKSLENMGSLSLRFVSKLNKSLAEIKENWNNSSLEDH